MSVPLDRLYNFLHAVSDQDIIIYRWHVPGSRKLEHCTPLYPLPRDRVKKFSTMHMVCHDQEPLFFDQWEPAKLEPLFLSPQYLNGPREIANTPYSVLMNAIFGEFFLHDRVLLLHSEQRSQELEQFEANGAVGCYWWSHAMIAQDWYRYARLDPRLHATKQPKKDFLIYNRAWSGTREYRLKFAEMLVDHDLHGHCQMGFAETDAGIDYRDHQYHNTAFSINRSDLEQNFAVNQSPPESSADYDSNDYTSTGIEIVLETLFDDVRWHLTEKSLRPIACGQPFILAATPGSLEYLHSYGFQTFAGIIDESYDQVQDPIKRLEKITTLMQDIAGLPAHEKHSLWSHMQVRADHNRRRFFSQEFHDQVVGEFQKNLGTAVKTMQQHATAAQWRSYMREFGPDIMCAPGADTRQDVVRKWLRIQAAQQDK
jgi:hypothetical protein